MKIQIFKTCTHPITVEYTKLLSLGNPQFPSSPEIVKIYLVYRVSFPENKGAKPNNKITYNITR